MTVHRTFASLRHGVVWLALLVLCATSGFAQSTSLTSLVAQIRDLNRLIVEIPAESGPGLVASQPQQLVCIEAQALISLLRERLKQLGDLVTIPVLDGSTSIALLRNLDETFALSAKTEDALARLRLTCETRELQEAHEDLDVQLSLLSNVKQAVSQQHVNRRPFAEFEYAPIAGRVPLTIEFDSGASMDPDGTNLARTWYFAAPPVTTAPAPPSPEGAGTRPPGSEGAPSAGGQGTRPPGTSPSGPGGPSTRPPPSMEVGHGTLLSRIFQKRGVHEVALVVRDDRGAVDRAVKQIVVVDATDKLITLAALPGTLGSSPFATTVYRASLAEMGVAKLAAITLIDRSSGRGMPGALTGIDLDAVIVSSTDCDTAACTRTVTPKAIANSILFLPGRVRQGPALLAGLSEYGSLVDPTGLNTLGDVGSSDGAFVSLGEGGAIQFHFEPPLDASDAFLYLGEVGDQDDLSGSDFSVAALPVPFHAPLIEIGPTGGAALGRHSALVVPEGALATPTVVQLVESPTEGVAVSLSPSVTYGDPAWLFIEDLAPPLYRQDIDPPGLVATYATAGGLVTQIYGHSEFGGGPAPTACGEACTLHEWAGPAGECMKDTERGIRKWLIDGKFTQSQPPSGPLAYTQPMCEADPTVLASMTFQEVPGTDDGVRVQYRIAIPTHAPKFQSTMYAPSLAHLQSLTQCSASDAQKAYVAILNHENEHVKINRNPQNLTFEVPPTNVWIASRLDPGHARLAAYLKACTRFYQMTLAPKQSQIDRLYNADRMFSSISAACLQCNPSTSNAPRVYCPCDDPDHGKPRSYSSETECASMCPSGLKCFTTKCVAPP